jgi:hypothetical protein
MWKGLKKVARFLVGRVAVRWRCEWQEEGQKWRVFTDSDSAGCQKTRKSSSGGVVMLGKHCIKSWCSTQGAVALSSAEAEHYSVVEGVLRVRGLQNIGPEIGMDGSEENVVVELLVDSSAAKSFASRRGVGKIRHMEVNDFAALESTSSSTTTFSSDPSIPISGPIFCKPLTLNTPSTTL